MVNIFSRAQARSISIALFCVMVFASAITPANAISLIRDTEIEQLLKEYTDPIVSAAKLDPNVVTLYIVNDPSLNAFVVGGHNIFFHTGMIVAVDNPNQLKGVIAHETAHIAGRHGALRRDAMASATRPMLLSMALGIFAIAAGAPDAGMAIITGGQHIATMDILAYTRTQEASADQAGVGYLEKTGQSPYGIMSFFSKLRSQEVLSASRQWKYFRTHPLSSDRMGALRARVNSSRYLGRPDSDSDKHRLKMAQAKLRGFLDSPKAALNRFPTKDKSAPARYGRSVAYFRNADTEKALTEINSLIADEPSNPFFHELKGQILFESGRVRESIPSHQRSAELSPKSALFRLNVAQAIIADPKSETDMAANTQAQKELKRALDLDSDLSFAWHQLAITYARQDNPGMADMATAERYYLVGDIKQSAYFAMRAQSKLERGSIDWNRAVDILHVAQEYANQDKKRRR